MSTPAMAPRNQFNERQEGQRFLTPLKTIAPSPRNVREPWEFETDEFDEFAQNVANMDLIQDPAVASLEAFVTKYPQHDADFDPGVEWVLLAGERRYRALARAGSPESVTAVVLRNNLLAKGDFVLISENSFRKGLDPIQEAQLLNRVREEEDLTYDEILKHLGGKSSIKRRSDLSKRFKLLELQDGPLRRAIRQFEIGLEPAYTLVSRLKKPELIEQGWAVMQETGNTARAVCDILLGTADAPAQHRPVADPKPAEQAEPAAHAEELEAPAYPQADTASFADETSNGAVKVPKQQIPNPLTVEGNQDDIGSARLDACTKLVSSRAMPSLDGVTRDVVAHALLDASSEVFALAHHVAGVTESSGSRYTYVVSLTAGESDSAVRLAYAVVLAADELHLRSLGKSLDARAADYLTRLHDVGYDITPYEAALTAVSSAKL